MNTKYAGKSDEAIIKATGKSWSEWFQILDKEDASKLPHKEIVLLLHNKNLVKKGKDFPAGKSFNAGWWAQSIVVGYEEKIGRRVFGATTHGNYTVTVGKTLNGTVDVVLKLWESYVKNKKEFNKVKVKDESWTSRTNDWRYWKVDLADGAKVMAGIGPKPEKKSAFSITVDKLKGEKEVEEWRKYWKVFLKKL